MATIQKIENRPLHQVAEFHEAFGHPILSPMDKPTPERVALRIRLLREEAKELAQGIENRDLHNAAKELTDLYYVYWGAVLEFGMYRAIQPSQVDSGNRTPRLPMSFMGKLFLLHISQKIDRLSDNPDTSDFIKLRNEIDQMCKIMGMSSQIEKVFDEVHRSNMSKVFPDGTVRYDEGGKVLKPDTYSKADIKSILEL